jgi:hypothetical protein
LLRYDYEILSHLAPGADPPVPLLYDPELHKQHRSGHYRPLKKGTLVNAGPGLLSARSAHPTPGKGGIARAPACW